MARINLLPWRAERRKARQKEFSVMLGAAAVGGLLLSALFWFHVDREIAGQNERNAYVSEQIAQVQKQLDEIKKLEETKDRLLKRKEIIEKLQADRSQMVHLFDSLVRTIPDGVALTSIKQDDDTLTLEGRSQSNARVSTYLRNLEGSGWMTSPELAVIEAKGTDKGLPYEFRLQVKLANPNSADKDGDGEPDGPPVVPAGDAPAADAATAAGAPAAGATSPATPAAPATGAAAPTTPQAAPAATPGAGS